MTAKVLMVQGTSSDAGKTLITAGLCRLFVDEGFSVFPFKSQNMSSNSHVLPTGEEMSRAQVLQAEAARRQPDVRMNPVLLKPVEDSKSQVYVNGNFHKLLKAVDYYAYKAALKPIIKGIFVEVSNENNLVILEGAGSPAEINLNEHDFVNMGMAEMADSPIILVADIDRGGVFASIYGTIKLLKPAEQERIKGVIINKFRGDIRLLDDGLRMIEELTGVPVIGVIPYIDLALESEDSLALNHAATQFDTSKQIDIAILEFKHMKNFSDLNSLSIYEDVSIRYIKKLDQTGKPDILIIPDTQALESNLERLKEAGWVKVLKKLLEQGTRIISLGLGSQLLSREIIKVDQTSLEGLGLIETTTKLLENPHLQQIKGSDNHQNLTGLVAQVASMTYNDEVKAFIQDENVVDGITTHGGQLIGTSINGLFENLAWTRQYLNDIRIEKGLTPLEAPQQSYNDFKDTQYDKLAHHLSEHIDLKALKAIIQLELNLA